MRSLDCIFRIGSKMSRIHVLTLTLILLSFSLCAPFNVVQLADATATEWKSPTITEPITDPFENPEYAFSPDNQYATCWGWWMTVQYYYGFGFAVPSTATITGIEVKIEAHGEPGINGEGGKLQCRLKNEFSRGIWSTFFVFSPWTDSVDTKGGSTDTWGLGGTWKPSDFNNGYFGIDCTPYDWTGTTQIDHIQARVHYTLSAVQRKLTVSSAHDSPSPPNGDNYRDDGSSVTCSVTSPVTEGGVVYTCTGWTGTGSVPSSGTGKTVTFTITQDSSITWNWIVTPADCGWPVLVAPVQISSNAGYSVGDTLTARFAIQNQGTAAIHLDKLLLGGRFNYGGTLPGGGFPDFSYSSVTLQAGQTYQYEGTLYLTEAGHYEFFVAYYIANPTEAERVRCALDPSNWNTCIDLAPGLTDNDRTWSVQVIANPGNLRAVSIEPIQVAWGADLVQDKLTDFKIGYESTFDVNVEANIRLDLPGFSPNSYEFTYNFAPGSGRFVIGSVHSSSPFFLARTKPEATFRFSIDPDNLIVETDETDNTFPRAGYEEKKVINTKPLKILFVPVRFDQEEGYPGPFTGFPKKWFLEHAEESVRYLKATYPLAESEVSYGTGSFSTPINAGSKPGNKVAAALFRNNLLKKLTQLAIDAKYDRVVGVVSSQFMNGIPGEESTLGFTHVWGWGRATIVIVGCWNVLPHELGHTYGLSHSNYNGEGYYVAGRQWVMRQTFMATEDIEYPPVDAIYMKPVPRLWIRSEEYQKLLTAFKEGVDPEALLACGTVWLNGTVSLDYWHHLPMGTLDFEEGGSGNYSIVQTDGVGNVLSNVRFNATFEDVFHGELFDAMPFVFTIPYAPGAKLIQILNATDHVVASRIISDNAPTVHIISPNGGEVLTSESVQISWEGSDLDGDPIVYGLLISGDGGLTWNPIETDLTQTTYDLPLTGFSGGNNYIVKVISSDGVNTGEDISDGFFTISSFAINAITPPQFVSSGGRANYTLNITSYGGFSNPIILNATSSTTDKLVFQWINGSEILPVPNGSIEVILEIEVPYGTEGGNHTVVLSGISGNNTEVAVAYLFASSHDLTISGITSSKTVVGQGFSMAVNVTVENHGNFGETFAVSLYGNQTLIVKGSAYLSPQNSTTVTLTWNASGFAKGNYTISAYAEPVPNETYTTDNTYIGEIVTVAMPGDVNADGTLDIFDIATVALAFSSTPNDPNWIPVADINNDGTVDIFDIVVVALHFGETG